MINGHCFSHGDCIDLGQSFCGIVDCRIDNGYRMLLMYNPFEVAVFEDFSVFKPFFDVDNFKFMSADSQKKLMSYLDRFGFKVNKDENGVLKITRLRHKNDSFYYIGTNFLGSLCVLLRTDELNYACDELWQSGNYFSTRDEAASALNKINELLLDLKKERSKK